MTNTASIDRCTHGLLDPDDRLPYETREDQCSREHATPPPVGISTRWAPMLGNFSTEDTHTVRPDGRTACGRDVVDILPGRSFVSCRSCRRSTRWPVAY